MLAARPRAGTERELANVTDLPPPAIAGIVEAIDGSAGQALPAIAQRPGSEQVVAAVSQAFADAARLAGLVAAAFVAGGLLMSLRLPDIRYADAEPAPESA